MKVALCQINPTVGDLASNFEKIKEFYLNSQPCDGVIFPECAMTGYPLEDLVLKNAFMQRVQSTVHNLVQITKNHSSFMLIGTPWILEDGHLINAALWIEKGEIRRIFPKCSLPNNGVFDEKRVFQNGPLADPISFNGVRFGVLICEDMWNEKAATHIKEKGADVLIVINGSPFDHEKHQKRLNHAKDRVQQTNCPLLYVNLVGGQDSLVFDGKSFVMDNCGFVIEQLPSFREATGFVHIAPPHIHSLSSFEVSSKDELRDLYQALVLGLRDYVNKNGFKGVALGMSGGIDSAISAAIAVDALGPKRVLAVMMPSPYTSQESLNDAQDAAQALEVTYESIPIQLTMDAYHQILTHRLKDKKPDITEENIQSRIRGMILMAISNQTGWMVLSTGNKSEMSAGYATLYGDMCGGYNALKDVYKTKVFELSHWRNNNHCDWFLGPKSVVIPENIIKKPPSAELRPNQKDEDSLLPYDILDGILQGLIEDDLFVDELTQKGFKRSDVEKVVSLLDRAEYKRRQAPPGPKVTPKALAYERRYPITNGFR